MIKYLNFLLDLGDINELDGYVGILALKNVEKVLVSKIFFSLKIYKRL